MSPKASEVPEGILEWIQGHMVKRLIHELRLNAATGYQLYPEYPVPEVLERPGWKVVTAPRGAWSLVFPVKESESIQDMMAGKGSEAPPVNDGGTALVKPMFQMEVVATSAAGGEVDWLFGVGLNEKVRRVVVFHRRVIHGDTEG